MGLIRILTGLFFIVSAASKLSSMESFELYIFSFGFAGFDLCSWAARLLVIAEASLGLGMVLNLFRRITLGITWIFLGIFSAFLIWRMAAGDSRSCHCMGELIDMNPFQSLIKNLLIAVALAFGWRKERRPGNGKISDFIIIRRWPIALISIAITTVITFTATPPDAMLRSGHESDDLSMEKFTPVADSLGLDKGRRAICFYSASCEHCIRCASKMSGIIRRHSLPEDSVTVLFMQTSNSQDSLVHEFFRNHGNGIQLPYHYLHPYFYLPLTNGSMPLVVLFEDGKLIREYDYVTLDEDEIVRFFGK